MKLIAASFPKKMMQQVFLFLFALCLSTTVSGRCGSSDIRVWPESPILSINPVFVITFHESSQEAVHRLNNGYPVYLKSGTQKIPLVITDTLKGAFKVTQVVARPAVILTTGTVYELVIDHLPAKWKTGRWNNDQRQWEPNRWKTGSDADHNAPEWVAEPVYQGKHYQLFGCGPERLVHFTFKSSDESQVMVKAVVKNLKTGSTTAYYLHPNDEQVSVGHGMCSGGFYFNEGTNYEVTFALMDASGNQSKDYSKPVRFTGPEVEDQKRPE
jgi:hypothetical protein